MLTLLLKVVFIVSPYLCADLQPVLGSSFTFRQNCKTDEEGKLLRAEPHGEVEVAVHQRGVWTPARGYRGRIFRNSSILFRRIFYNDSGFYLLRCDSQEMRIQVKVLVPFNVTVKEGEKATLPCRIPSTTDNKCLSVRWEIKKQVVFGWNSCTDKGNGTADGSLNLPHVRKEHQGYYFCHKQNEDGEKYGDPSVVRLKVKGKDRDGTSAKIRQENRRKTRAATSRGGTASLEN
ncbi:uncharacterized protein LOC102301642 isoform X2 [Haplochromis burtoni]|uniref:uncharacterized protein LOC102301642 isoform X2 n=1 Tax=Haplochromis burtoni TaxID=8153 RepID=UPI001C2D2A9F|nr:uncharacterized protein LOC102301642 isoform X2 [Haplochromis burtoni]